MKFKCGHDKSPINTYTNPNNGYTFCKTCRNKGSGDWHKTHLEKGRSYNIEYRAKLKAEVMQHYCTGCVRCQWKGCIISELEALSIDHVNNNGVLHRKEIGVYNGDGVNLLRWLRNEGYPSGFGVLCLGHNMMKNTLWRRGQNYSVYLPENYGDSDVSLSRKIFARNSENEKSKDILCL
jgi:hypothetical protein